MSTENKVFKMSLDVSGLISNYKKAIQTMQDIGGPNKAITSFEQQLRKLETEFNNLQKIGKEGIAKDPQSVNSYTKAVDKAYKKLITLGDEMNKLGKNSGAFNINAVKNLEKEIKELTKSADNFRKAFSKELSDAGLSKKLSDDISKTVKTQDQLIEKLKEEKKIRQENLKIAEDRQKLTQKQTVERAENVAANLINRTSTSAASLSPIAQEQITKTIKLQWDRYNEAIQKAQEGKNVQIPDMPVKDITDFIQKINAKLASAVKDARDADDGMKVFEERWKEIIKEIQQMTGTTSKANTKSGITRLTQNELFGDIAAAKNRAKAPFQAVEDVMRNAPDTAALRNALTSVQQINDIINQAINGSSNLNDALKTLVNTENEVTKAEKGMSAAKAEDQKTTDKLANSTKDLSAAATKQANDQNKANQAMRETATEVKRTEGAISKFARMVGSMFSLYTIFAAVRSEIRKTYEDIKTLDKSFASIAMVTDKSVSDMWGTYEQYANMASELGQKTNSVIEASALYYQQGLDTNEALELTTHTMKLATLANENYKTATEEMTAAIRGFRMEMDSGSHVTDVYSTLAASAAASVNDIASAISRTASIANSAGSSFENTSAFLTKVIETTQESAENIGYLKNF